MVSIMEETEWLGGLQDDVDGKDDDGGAFSFDVKFVDIIRFKVSDCDDVKVPFGF